MCACLIRRPGKAADRTCRRKEPELQEGGSRNFHKEPDYITGGIPYYMQFPSPLRNTIHFFIVSTCSYYSQRKFAWTWVGEFMSVCLQDLEKKIRKGTCVWGKGKLISIRSAGYVEFAGKGGRWGVKWEKKGHCGRFRGIPRLSAQLQPSRPRIRLCRPCVQRNLCLFKCMYVYEPYNPWVFRLEASSPSVRPSICMYVCMYVCIYCLRVEAIINILFVWSMDNINRFLRR